MSKPDKLAVVAEKVAAALCGAGIPAVARADGERHFVDVDGITLEIWEPIGGKRAMYGVSGEVEAPDGVRYVNRRAEVYAPSTRNWIEGVADLCRAVRNLLAVRALFADEPRILASVEQARTSAKDACGAITVEPVTRPVYTHRAHISGAVATDKCVVTLQLRVPMARLDEAIHGMVRAAWGFEAAK